jgi:hypothetical protein
VTHPLFLAVDSKASHLAMVLTLGTWIFLKLNQFRQGGGDKWSLKKKKEKSRLERQGRIPSCCLVLLHTSVIVPSFVVNISSL